MLMVWLFHRCKTEIFVFYFFFKSVFVLSALQKFQIFMQDFNKLQRKTFFMALASSFHLSLKCGRSLVCHLWIWGFFQTKSREETLPKHWEETVAVPWQGDKSDLFQELWQQGLAPLAQMCFWISVLAPKSCCSDWDSREKIKLQKNRIIFF